MKQYVKCLAILISNCYPSTIVDERNFNADDRYRCFQIVLND